MSVDELRVLATQQHSLFTTAQAEAVRLPRLKIHRLTQDGTVRQIRRGVYSTDPFQADHLEELRAAWLSLDPAKTVAERLRDKECAVVATTSAAYVHKVGNFTTYKHEFFSPKRKQSRADDIHIRIRDLPASDIETVEGLRVTTITRTVLDLLADGEELEHISDLLVDAINKDIKVDWKRIRKETYKFEKIYAMEGFRIFRALAASSSTTEEQAALTQALIASNFPNLHKRLSQQWSDLLRPVLQQIELDLPKIPVPQISLGADKEHILETHKAFIQKMQQEIQPTLDAIKQFQEMTLQPPSIPRDEDANEQ